MNGADVLNGWKEIAEYMGRGVRTVQRWHIDLNLPVHQGSDHGRAPVTALKSELMEWLRQVSPSNPPQQVDERWQALAERNQQIQSGFVLAEMRMAGTLAGIAAQFWHKQAKRERFLTGARRGYKTALRFGRRVVNQSEWPELQDEIAAICRQIEDLQSQP
jgi:hypothetical protein